MRFEFSDTILKRSMWGEPERLNANGAMLELKEDGKSISFAWKKNDSSTCQKHCSALLELAASNDLIGFKQAIEEDGSAIDEISFWYGRRIGSKQMGFEERTPLMIAALYGSVDVLSYILSSYKMFGIDVNFQCGSEKATALHCAAAGGSCNAMETVKLLLQHAANVNIRDADERRPADVVAIARQFSDLKYILEGMLETGCHKEGSFPKGSTDISEATKKEPSKEGSDVLADVNQTPKLSKTPSSKNCENNSKKEYPVDPSLPDINNGMYSTDEFRMYCFKVRPCSRAYSHDWTECPFVHPGENARRRDPRKYHYSCVPCPDFRKGSCRRGDSCEYAHGVFECWLHPAQYRTRLCKDETNCTRRVCFFAHKVEELRPLSVLTGSAVSSPRASSSVEMNSSLSPLPLGSPSSVYLASSFSPNPKQSGLTTPPMSPSSSPANALAHSLLSGAAWTQSNVPALHLPSGVLQGSGSQASRLRSSRNARDIAIEEMVQDSEYEEKLLNELSSLSAKSRMSPLAAVSSGPANPSLATGKYWTNMGTVVAPTKLEDVFDSEVVLSPKISGSVFPQIQGQSHFQNQIQSQSHSQVSQTHPMKQGGISSQGSSHFQPLARSPRELPLHCNISSPLVSDLAHLNSDDSSLSPAVVGMNSRSAMFALKDGRSFSSRDLSANMRLPSLVDGWGSPTGKANWAPVKGELHTLRKSASFGVRTSVPADIPPVPLSAKDNRNADVDEDHSVGLSVKTLKNRQPESMGSSVMGTWLGQRHLDQQMVA